MFFIFHLFGFRGFFIFFWRRHNLVMSTVFFNFSNFLLPQMKQIVHLKYFSWQFQCFFSIRELKKKNHSVLTIFKNFQQKKLHNFRIFLGVVSQSRLDKWTFGILVWSKKFTEHCPIYWNPRNPPQKNCCPKNLGILVSGMGQLQVFFEPNSICWKRKKTYNCKIVERVHVYWSLLWNI